LTVLASFLLILGKIGEFYLMLLKKLVKYL